MVLPIHYTEKAVLQYSSRKHSCNFNRGNVLHITLKQPLVFNKTSLAETYFIVHELSDQIDLLNYCYCCYFLYSPVLFSTSSSTPGFCVDGLSSQLQQPQPNFQPELQPDPAPQLRLLSSRQFSPFSPAPLFT